MSLPPSMEKLRRAREAVRIVAANSELPEWPLTLIVTELLANAVAASPRNEVVDLRVVCDDSGVEVRVVDRGPGLSKKALADRLVAPPPGSEPRGRGLYLVGQYADHFTVDRVDDRTVAEARLTV